VLPTKQNRYTAYPFQIKNSSQELHGRYAVISARMITIYDTMMIQLQVYVHIHNIAEFLRSTAHSAKYVIATAKPSIRLSVRLSPAGTVLGPQFRETVYISEVNRGRNVQSTVPGSYEQ